MTFATEVVKPDRGRALRFDFSYDDFSTVTYRLSDVEGKLDGTNWYTPRVVSCGAFRRALGQNRIAASGGFELVIANTDGAYDAFCNRTSLDDTAKLRVRAYVVLYDTTPPVTSFTSQQLGEYVVDRWPKRTNDVIRLQLADDILGALSQGVTLPTFSDWSAVGTAATNPTKNGAGYPDSYNIYSPVQLCFGEDWHLAFPHFIPRDPDAAFTDEVIVPICCTTDTATAAADSEISEVRIQLYSEEGGERGPLLDVPYSYTYAGDRLWTVGRSPTITKDSKSFKIIYLRVNVVAFYAWMYTYHRQFMDIALSADAEGNSTNAIVDPWFARMGNYPEDTLNNAGGSSNTARQYQGSVARVQHWYIKGYPLSARTYTSTAQQHACDIAKDFVTQYTKGTFACDETSRAATKHLRAGARASGVVQPWTEDKGGGRKAVRTTAMRVALTQLCQSSDFDVFANWDGDIGFSTDGFSFELAAQLVAGTTPTLEEAKLLSLEEWIPSNGERGAPFNRLYFEGGRASPADGLDVPFQGPWDFDSSYSTGVAIASRVIEATYQQGWRPVAQQRLTSGSNPLTSRILEVESRPRIRFRYPLDALRLDLGDYFYLPWGRNVGSPYATAQLWQAESLVYSPQDDTVEIEAAWRNSLTTDYGYLLDDMTMAVRTYATFGRDATVTDASLTVTFASGDLYADGVETGDVLVLQDTTQADDVFTRNRAMLVSGVLSATSLRVDTSDTDFDAPGGTTVSNWTIYRGATTYHTAVSDPTNYPSGGTMYGKATNTSGAFSDASTGNRLLDG